VVEFWEERTYPEQEERTLGVAFWKDDE